MPREKSNFGPEYAIFLATLRRLREASGRTQTDVANFLKRDQSVVSKCERGERRIDVIELRDYCMAIGVRLGGFIEVLETDIAEATTAKASKRAPRRSSRK